MSSKRYITVFVSCAFLLVKSYVDKTIIVSHTESIDEMECIACDDSIVLCVLKKFRCLWFKFIFY